jgi:class 3 adenylate cyclase
MATATRAAAPTVTGTIVFTDIVGFTEFTALRGDDEALALLSDQERLVGGALPNGARVVKELGDGLLLWFPEAASALRCALALQRRFEAESVATGSPLWVRMGMHHGRALRRGDDLIGHDVNVAARIVSVASPGEVLVSEAARVCIGPRLTDVCFDELGPVVMKGIPEPVRLWRATLG